NGSGKSTLIELITSDNPKGYQQDVTLFGQPKGQGSSVWDIKKNIGYYTPSQLDYF
ncbi:MAG TPA: ABC transporter, partial [Flavobacteriaceae bacterium]|nr:ABC transporter [Flavobacteriaceae bacterium]